MNQVVAAALDPLEADSVCEMIVAHFHTRVVLQVVDTWVTDASAMEDFADRSCQYED